MIDYSFPKKTENSFLFYWQWNVKYIFKYQNNQIYLHTVGHILILLTTVKMTASFKLGSLINAKGLSSEQRRNAKVVRDRGRAKAQDGHVASFSWGKMGPAFQTLAPGCHTGLTLQKAWISMWAFRSNTRKRQGPRTETADCYAPRCQTQKYNLREWQSPWYRQIIMLKQSCVNSKNLASTPLSC